MEVKRSDLLAKLINSKPFIFGSAITLLIAGVTGLGLIVISGGANTDTVVRNLSQTNKNTTSAKFTGIDTTLTLELAKDSASWTEGLMFRTSLPTDHGMLFVFPQSRMQSFWMKNTFVSLDIIFLDSQLQVVNFHQRTKTNQTTELYDSTAPAQYVLELPGGWIAEHNLKIGTKLNISL